MSRVKEVEDRLKLYKHYQVSIKNLEEDLQLLEDIDGLGAVNYDQVGSNTNKINNIVEDIGLSNVEKEHYLRHLIKRNTNIINGINRAIEALTEEEAEVINDFYFEGQTAGYIADKIKVSDSQVYVIRKKALESMSICIFGK